MNIFKKLNTNFLILLFKKSHIICTLIIVTIFFLDRFSKIKIIEHQIDKNLIYVNKFINFDLVWNTGIGFGFFKSNSGIIYSSTTLLIGVVILLLIYLTIKAKLTEKILFSLIIGGALGNFYDRMTYFAVPDFIDMHYKSFHWFTFNIADIFITIGIAILITKDFFLQNDKN